MGALFYSLTFLFAIIPTTTSTSTATTNHGVALPTMTSSMLVVAAATAVIVYQSVSCVGGEVVSPNACPVRC